MIDEQLIGERLVFGIPGPRPTRADLQLFRDTHAGGLILYRINYRSPVQIRALVREMEESLGRRLLVTVDHEGGRVIMFQGGVTVFPDNLAFGTGATPADAARQGAVEGRELRRLGMDVAFSPTVDVLTRTHSPNIGIRSYGDNPDRVAAMAVARLRALQAQGVSACAKHFPGLGPASLDPHLDLPVIRTTWAEMRRSHLKPFRAAIAAGVDMIMSSHPLYPRLEPRPRTPATFSKKLITGLLREELGFRGVIASDDLEMGALRRLAPVGRAAVLAAAAGHDLILCCHRADLQRGVFHALLEAVRSGELSCRDLECSVERLRRLRGFAQKRFAPGPAVADPAGAALAARVARRAVTVTGPALRSPDARPAKTLVIFPRFEPLSRRIMIEPMMTRPGAFFKKTVPDPRARLCPIDINPGPRERRRVLQRARNADQVVYVCFDAHLQPGDRALMASLQRRQPKPILVLLRNPYDRVFADPRSTVVTAFGFRQCQIAACLERIFGS